MQVLGIDRVLIATPDLDGSVGRFEELLGLSFGSRVDPADVPLANRTSRSGVEFVTSDDPDSAVGRFLAEHGPGVYAVVLEVADLEAARAELSDRGVDPVAEMAVGEFREVFYHPSTFEGTLLGLAAYDHPAELALRAGGDGD